MQETYNVTGMTCAACQARVQKSVSNLTGVQECNVNLLKNSMVVTDLVCHIGVMGLLIEIRHTCYLLLKFVSPDLGRKNRASTHSHFQRMSQGSM